MVGGNNTAMVWHLISTHSFHPLSYFRWVEIRQGYSDVLFPPTFPYVVLTPRGERNMGGNKFCRARGPTSNALYNSSREWRSVNGENNVDI